MKGATFQPCQFLLPEIRVRETAAPKKHGMKDVRMWTRRTIPQTTVCAMRKEYEAMPDGPNGRKPHGAIKVLAEKYGIGYDYTVKLLTGGIRDDEREPKRKICEDSTSGC